MEMSADADPIANVSDETIRALLERKDLISGREHLRRIVRFLSSDGVLAPSADTPNQWVEKIAAVIRRVKSGEISHHQRATTEILALFDERTKEMRALLEQSATELEHAVTVMDYDWNDPAVVAREIRQALKDIHHGR